MKLSHYVLRRLLLAVLVLWGVSVLVFVLTRVVPVDPATLWAGPRATAEQIEAARSELGLDKPLPVQYFNYVTSLVQGDWGISIRTHQPVLSDIGRYLPASLELVMCGMLTAIVVGVPAGVLCATKKGTAADHVTRVLSVAFVSVPAFWLGMVFQLVFFQRLRVLPLGGRAGTLVSVTHSVPTSTGLLLVDSLLAGDLIAFRDALAHVLLPAITLASYPVGLITRMTRASLLEIMGEDYIRAARAFGLSERMIAYRYALKNAVAPTLTVLGLSFVFSLVGAFVVEAVFNWPGLGQYMASAIVCVDYPVITGVTILIAALYVLVNLLVDLTQALLNPRVRLQ